MAVDIIKYQLTCLILTIVIHGICVGVNDGFAEVGLKEGNGVVGINVGLKVGFREGIELGLKVGGKEGCEVGAIVGSGCNLNSMARTILFPKSATITLPLGANASPWGKDN